MLATGQNLDQYTPQTWQRQMVVASDGTQFLAYWDNGASATKFVTSTDNYASVSGATTVINGGGDLSVEIDETDKG